MKTIDSAVRRLLSWAAMASLVCFSLFGIVACEDKEQQYKIYENQEIRVCGVENPLKNIEWLKIMCEKNNIHSSFKIDLYEVNETKEQVILIPYNPDYKQFDYWVYDCSGNMTKYYGGLGRERMSVSAPFPINSYCTYICTIWSLTIK